MDRRLWTKEEDQHIIRLVNKLGTKKWPLISQKLCAETQFQRTGKQCRQRWYNHLNPQIDNSIWREQDENRLFEAHKQHGNKWKVISQLFVGRTDNSIKNHFYSTIRRCLRRINKLQGQKNSTLKMRTIKPYVLSKILADRNLTQTILQMGKTKPNKSKARLESQYFEQFNNMIAKLYQINKEYELVKTNKKQLVETKLKENEIQSQQDQEENSSSSPDSMSAEESNRMELEAEHAVHSPSQEKKVQSNQPSLQSNYKSPKTINRRKALFKINKNNLKPLQQYKLLSIPDLRQQFSEKRSRKAINYMKLNEGILCQNERHEATDETNNESELSKKKVLIQASEQQISLQQQLFGLQNLEDIIQEQQKSNQKDLLQNRPYSFHQEQDSKISKNFQISHPSPSYCKNSYNFFDDLVVVGTHLKIFPTPRKSYSSQKLDQEREQRRQNQEQFIQQILQINFDPQFALNSPGEQHQDQQNNPFQNI